MLKNSLRLIAFCVASAMTMGTMAQQKSVIFKNGFDSESDAKKWSLIYGAKLVAEQAQIGRAHV